MQPVRLHNAADFPEIQTCPFHLEKPEIDMR